MPQPTDLANSILLDKSTLCSVNPLIGYIDDFVDTVSCSKILRDLACVDSQPSSVSGSYGPTIDERRIAQSYKIPHGSVPSVEEVTEKVAGLFSLKKRLCEYPELITYQQGGTFKRHFDAGLSGSMPQSPTETGKPSQRIFTAILYLNDDFEGGVTSFPRLELDLTPKRGRLAFWQNTKTGGLGVHPFSMHEGCPVTKGQKQIISFWFRDQPWAPLELQ